MITKEKWIFSSFARLLGVFLILAIGGFIYFYVNRDSINQSNHIIIIFTLGIFLLIALMLGLGRAKMKIDTENGLLSVKMGLLGITLISDNRKLPAKIQKIQARKKEIHFKTFFQRLFGSKKKAYSYEVLLITLKNKPIRLFSLQDESDFPIIDSLAKAYQVEKEFIEVK